MELKFSNTKVNSPNKKYNFSLYSICLLVHNYILSFMNCHQKLIVPNLDV